MLAEATERNKQATGEGGTGASGTDHEAVGSKSLGAGRRSGTAWWMRRGVQVRGCVRVPH